MAICAGENAISFSKKIRPSPRSCRPTRPNQVGYVPRTIRTANSVPAAAFAQRRLMAFYAGCAPLKLIRP
jgi:hypothetical protein